MKKSAEYAKEILDTMDIADKDQVKTVVNQVLKSITGEMTDLIKIRGVKTEDGLIAIVREQNNKWKAICRKMNHPVWGILDTAFIAFLEQDPTLAILTKKI